MSPRFFVDRHWHAGDVLALPPEVARHVQVLRLQPGAEITLFNGAGGEWQARVTSMGRSHVEVQVAAQLAADRELPVHVTLAVGMPANDRMDGLVEKATELGVAALQPLVCERSVLRLNGERAEKKVQHWRAVATSASEQCGRTRVPIVATVRTFADWLRTPDAGPAASTAAGTATDRARHVLSLRGDALPLTRARRGGAVLLLSGPEGGLADDEEAAARAAGFGAVTLGPRVLRADTAPLAALAVIGAWAAS